MSWIYVFVIPWLMIIGWVVGRKILERLRTPYRWTCPRCNFEIRTNVLDTYEISKSSHNHSSTDEYKLREP